MLIGTERRRDVMQKEWEMGLTRSQSQQGVRGRWIVGGGGTMALRHIDSPVNISAHGIAPRKNQSRRGRRPLQRAQVNPSFTRVRATLLGSTYSNSTCVERGTVRRGKCPSEQQPCLLLYVAHAIARPAQPGSRTAAYGTKSAPVVGSLSCPASCVSEVECAVWAVSKNCVGHPARCSHVTHGSHSTRGRSYRIFPLLKDPPHGTWVQHHPGTTACSRRFGSKYCTGSSSNGL